MSAPRVQPADDAAATATVPAADGTDTPEMAAKQPAPTKGGLMAKRAVEKKATTLMKAAAPNKPRVRMTDSKGLPSMSQIHVLTFPSFPDLLPANNGRFGRDVDPAVPRGLAGSHGHDGYGWREGLEGPWRMMGKLRKRSKGFRPVPKICFMLGMRVRCEAFRAAGDAKTASI